MFFSCSKFRNIINEKMGFLSDVVILFEPINTFQTKFFYIGVKPIGLIIYNNITGDEELTTHEEILAMFDGKQPIITINPAYVDIIKGSKIQGIVIQEPIMSFNGYEYSPVHDYKYITKQITNQVLKNKISKN